MLFIGRQQQRTCQTVSRRAFLQAGGSTVLGLSLADLLRCKAVAADLGASNHVRDRAVVSGMTMTNFFLFLSASISTMPVNLPPTIFA